MTNTQREQAHRLWDDLAAFPVTDTRTACDHLMRTIAGWIGADKSGWIGTVRLLPAKEAWQDGMSGWRQKRAHLLQPFTGAGPQRGREAPADPTDFGMANRELAKHAGRFRVHRLRDGFVPYESFRHTEHYRTFYTDIGVEDRIWIGFPASQDAESFFIFDRLRRPERFTAADAALAGYAMRGLKWFHRRMLLSQGLLLVQSPLTATERKVLRHLFSGKTVKQIAEAMQHSRHTTGDHIKEIFRKYGVNSRTELMAAWLNDGEGAALSPP